MSEGIDPRFQDALQGVSRAYERLVEALSILRSLDEIAPTALDENQLARSIIERIAAALAAENCSLLLLDAPREKLVLRAACSPLDDLRGQHGAGRGRSRQYPTAEGVMGKVLASGEPVILPDVQAVGDFAPWPGTEVEVRSLCCFPLRIEGTPSGVVNLSHSKPGFFSNDTHHVLQLVVSRIEGLFRMHRLHCRSLANEAHYSLVARHAGDAILVLDSQDRVLSANPAACRMADEHEEALLDPARPWQSRVHPEDIQAYQTARLHLHEFGEGVRLGYRITDASGQTRYLEEQSALQGQGSDDWHVVAIIRDDTERVEAQQELDRYRMHLEELVEERSAELVETNRRLEQEVADRREAEESLRGLATIVEQANECVLITDTQGRIEYVNPAFERVTGWRSSEVLGKTPALLRSGEHPGEFYKGLWGILTQGLPWKGRFINVRKDGSLYHEAASISPVRTPEGRVTHYVKVGHDDTREIELERHLHHSQKMEAIGTLAGGIAHDFNNILYAVMGYTKMARQDLGEAHGAAGMLDNALQGCERAVSLVNQILAFSRGGSDEPKRPVRLQGVIEDVLVLLRGSFPATIKIAMAIDGAVRPVVANPIQLHQMITNLGANAYQAMGEAGGELSITLEERKPSKSLLAANPELKPRPYAVLTVGDTGHGMDRKTLERIFDPFFSTKPVGEGTGMGLALVHAAVKAHEGAILVDSTPGAGSTFAIWLPVTARRAEAPVSAKAADQAPGTGRVMVVDDDEHVANVVKLTLENMGYAARVFTSSPEALRAFGDGNAFEAAVVDQVMPGMTGLELAAQMKALRPGFPIVLITGYSEIVDPGRQQDHPIDGCLPKPVREAELIQTLKRVLGNEAPGRNP